MMLQLFWQTSYLPVVNSGTKDEGMEIDHLFYAC
jgi:hypothetical protein